jgi:hypothetical protein
MLWTSANINENRRRAMIEGEELSARIAEGDTERMRLVRHFC